MTIYGSDWRKLREVAELIATGAAGLAASSSSPRADAALLLAHAIGRRREWIVAHPDAVASPEETACFEMLCVRRRDGVPIAYLVGSAHFYGREFCVDESVLIPRPETEHLVDEALRFIEGPARVLDVGAGCGAIACTLAAETRARVDATDLSPEAVSIARENARRLGLADRCTFYEGDLTQPVTGSRYGVIVANLPYIPTGDLPRAPDPVSYEPRAALDGGPDGLALYRRLARLLPSLIEPAGLVLLEAAPPTIERLAECARAALPTFSVTIGTDYAGLARYVKACGSSPLL